MEHSVEIEVLRRLLDLHELRSTSEAAAPRLQRTSVYVDRSRHDDELARLLRNQALIAGLSCDLPSPGSYFTADIGTVPVIIARARDGQVRAFLNACRHRGSAVATGRGEGSSGFTCRYHGWSYDLLGTLKARPTARSAFNGIEGCSKLIELPCVEDCGLLVVGTSPDIKTDVREFLAGLGDEFESHGFAAYRLVGERAARWAFNWKLGIETFMEAYHIFSLHRDTLGRQLKSAPMLSEFMGPHGRGIVMGNACPDLLDKPMTEWTRFHNATWVYWLFPNVVLSMPQSGHAELWTFVPADDRPDQSFVSVRFYAASSAPQDDDFWVRLIDFTMSVVDAEDFGQQLLIQRNIASGLLPEIVFGRNEPALIHFHEQLDSALGIMTECR